MLLRWNRLPLGICVVVRHYPKAFHYIPADKVKPAYNMASGALLQASVNQLFRERDHAQETGNFDVCVYVQLNGDGRSDTGRGAGCRLRERTGRAIR